MKKHVDTRNRHEVNKAIEVPRKLLTDDGRELAITSWSPVVEMEDVVRVTVTAFICQEEG